MNLKFGLVLLFSAISLCLNSQTNVGGVLSSNTTWTHAGSPYNVTSNLAVPSGIALTIEPGVEIIFDTDLQIIIQGTIKAIGDGANSIIFRGNVTGGAMLLFQKADLNNSSLSYVRFEGPKDGIRLCTNNNDNNSGKLATEYVNVINSKIETNGNNSGAELQMNNSWFLNSVVVSDYPNGERISITRSTLNGGQIIARDYSRGIFLFLSSSTNTNFSSGLYTYSNLVNSDIIHCVIEAEDESNLEVTYCYVKNTSINCPISSVMIRDCNFTWDTDYSLPTEAPWPCIIMGSGRIERSQLTGNEKLIAVVRAPGAYSNENTYPTEIHHNTFTGFGTVLKVKSGYYPGSGSGLVFIKYCKFYDTPQLNLIVNYSIYDVIARYDWWNTTSSTDIDKLIYDYWDDVIYGKVDYSDYLTDPDAPITLSVSADTLVLSAKNNSTAQFNVISTVDWEFGTEKPWVSVSQTLGKGNATITVTATENTSNQPRISSVCVGSYGIISQCVFVVQKAPVIFSVSADTLLISAFANSTESFDIESNTAWNVSADQEWLTIDKSAGSDTEKIIIKATANPFISARTAKITISGNDFESKTLFVVQEPGQPMLSVSNSALSISYEEGSIVKFTINSNTDWNIISDQDWLKADTLSGANNATISLIADVNPTTNPRFGIITISAIGVESRSIIVIQAASIVSELKADIQKPEIGIFPNPTSDKIFLTCNKLNSTDITYVLSSLDGKMMRANQVYDDITELDVSAFEPGIYILKIYMKGYIYFSKKIIKI